MKKTKIISLLLAVWVVLSLFPVNAGADEQSPLRISIITDADSKSAGQTFNYYLRIDENPGVTSLKLDTVFPEGFYKADLPVWFNEFVLSRVSYSGFSFKSQSDNSYTGKIFEVPVYVSDKVIPGEYIFKLRIDECKNADGKDVPVIVTNKSFTVNTHLLGDVDSDNFITEADYENVLDYLRTYNPETGKYGNGSPSFSDINGDGATTLADLMLIRKAIDEAETPAEPADRYGYLKLNKGIKNVCLKMEDGYVICTEDSVLPEVRGKRLAELNGYAVSNFVGIFVSLHSLDLHEGSAVSAVLWEVTESETGTEYRIINTTLSVTMNPTYVKAE